MPDAKSHSEPSMEEIIASISRVIAEDKHSGNTHTGNLRPGGKVAPGQPEGSDILELTQVVDKDGSVHRIASRAAAEVAPSNEPVITDLSPPARPHTSIRRDIRSASRRSILFASASSRPPPPEQRPPPLLNLVPCRAIGAARENCRSVVLNVRSRRSFAACCARCCNRGSTNTFPISSSGSSVRRLRESSENRGCAERPGAGSLQPSASLRPTASVEDRTV